MAFLAILINPAIKVVVCLATISRVILEEGFSIIYPIIKGFSAITILTVAIYSVIFKAIRILDCSILIKVAHRTLVYSVIQQTNKTKI